MKKYVAPIEHVTEDFIQYMKNARDEVGDLPREFDNDIHRWSLECESLLIHSLQYITSEMLLIYASVLLY